ncbi:MAG: hypothetical protein U1D06_02215, partial [Paracoccaceae bacterium]|nr:hypothetical protein [Paracoccaceae bacterium]
TGQPCASPLGQRALDQLAARIFGKSAPQLLVLRDSSIAALHLPGQIILLNRNLLEAQDGPATAAGHILAEVARDRAIDPLLPLLSHAGLRATFGLLTRGALDAMAIAGYGEVILRAPPAPLPDAVLLAQFKAAGVASTAYAYSLDASGESVLGLIEADPYPAGPPQPLLSDGDWVSLQTICAD